MEGLYYRLTGNEIVVSLQTGKKVRPSDSEIDAFKEIIKKAIPFVHQTSNLQLRPNSTGEDYGKWQVRMNVTPTNACARMAVKLLKQTFVDETKHEE